MPQVPSESVAESRSTISVAASRPAPASVPQSSVSGTEGVVYQGPPESATVWPVGAVVSALSVIVSVAVKLELFVAVTCCAPGSPAPAVQV